MPRCKTSCITTQFLLHNLQLTGEQSGQQQMKVKALCLLCDSAHWHRKAETLAP